MAYNLLSSNGSDGHSGNSKPGTVLLSTTSCTCTFTNVGGAFSTMRVRMPFEFFHFFSLTPRDFSGGRPTSSPPSRSAFNVLATMSGIVLSPAPMTTCCYDRMPWTTIFSLFYLFPLPLLYYRHSPFARCLGDCAPLVMPKL